MAGSTETLLELSLSRSALDRAAILRRDPEAVPRAIADPRTKVLDLFGDRAPYAGTADAPRLVYRAGDPSDADGLVLLLGRDRDGATVLAVVHPPEDDGGQQRGNLRKLAVALDDHDVDVFASAQGLANWHAGQGFCPACGAPTEPSESGWTRVCTREGRNQFPRTDPAVIMAVVDADDRLLLARGPQWPQGRLSVLAGFVEPGESLEAAVAREVLEEVGLVVTGATYRGNQPWPFPASLMVGFTARAQGSELHPDADEIVEARWLTRAEVAEEVAAGTLGLPGRLSIARLLIEDWFGGPIDEPHPFDDPRSR